MSDSTRNHTNGNQPWKLDVEQLQGIKELDAMLSNDLLRLRPRREK